MFKHFAIPPVKTKPVASPYSRDVDTANRERYLYLVDDVVPLPVRQRGSTKTKQWKQNVNRRYKLLRNTSGVERLYYHRPAKEYCNHNRTVKMKNKGAGKYVLCPTELEAMEIVRKDHATNHDGHNRMEPRLWQDYHIRNLRKLIEGNRAVCDICNGHATHVRKVVMAIITTHSNQLQMFDLATMPMRDRHGYKHFILVKDHFDKFMWGAALKNKKKEPVIAFLRWLYSSGNAALPDRWGSDNGGEFINALMKQLIAELAPLVTSHGMPRHPQSQGLVEISNKTCKRKVVQRCQAAGYTVAGQEFDWTPHFFQHIEIENTQPLKLYQEFTPYECRFFRPKMGAGCNTMEPADIAIMQKMMADRQQASGERLGHVGHIDVFKSGDVVHVRCEDKHMTDKKAIARWTARAIVHRPKINIKHFYELRWLSQGFSDKECPGALSHRLYICSRLKWVEPRVEARVYDFEHGYCIETDAFADGQSNYVFLDGEFKHKSYSGDTSRLRSGPSTAYSEHFEMLRPQTEDDTSTDDDGKEDSDVAGPDNWGKPEASDEDSDAEEDEDDSFLCASKPQHDHDPAGWGDTQMRDRMYSSKKTKPANTSARGSTTTAQRRNNNMHCQEDRNSGDPLDDVMNAQGEGPAEEKEKEAHANKAKAGVAGKRKLPPANRRTSPRSKPVVSDGEEDEGHGGGDISSEDDTGHWRSKSPLLHSPTHCIDVGQAWRWSSNLCHWHCFLLCELTMMWHTFPDFKLPKALRHTEYIRGLIHVFEHASCAGQVAEKKAIAFLMATSPTTFDVYADVLWHVNYACTHGWVGENSRLVRVNLQGTKVPGSMCSCGVTKRVNSTCYLQIADVWYTDAWR